MPQRVLVIGPGALGILVAVRLSNAGQDVCLAVREAKAVQALPETCEAIAADGTTIHAKLPAVWSPKGAGPFDALVLATKCDDAVPALKRWLPGLRQGGAVIALQNGIIGDDLAALAGDRLVECTVALPATLLGPGRSEQTGPGSLIVGPWPDGRMADASPFQAAADLMVDVAPTRIHMNMVGVKWSKLCLNSAITGVGMLTGKTLGDLVDEPAARTAMLHLISEGHRVGQEAGVRFEKVGGFHPGMFAVTRPTRLGLLKRHAILRVLGRRFRRQRSSSLQSLERGKKTEVRHLNGFIAAQSARLDLLAPVNESIVRLVEEIEAGARQPDVAHLAELPFRFH